MDVPFPAETSPNDQILKQKVKIYYGANAWGRREWIGEIYPPGTKEKDFLSLYVEHYNAIELNATHYQIYSASEIKRWIDKAEGKDFLFCPKVHQSISHFSTFIGVQDKTANFLHSLSAFGNHLGPVFLQLSDKFSPKKKEALYYYLQSLPKDIELFLEVGNPEWFEEGELLEHHKFLAANNIGSVINDAPDRPLHMELTIPKCFIRYTPTDNSLKVYEWFKKIKEWGANGLQEAYFFIQAEGKDKLAIQELEMFKKLVNGG